MTAVIKVTLIKISGTDRAKVILTGPNDEIKHFEFPLIWTDSNERQAVFWSLELHQQDPRTWPKKDLNIIQKACDLKLFINKRPSNERLKVIGTNLYQMVFGAREIGIVLNGLMQKISKEIPIFQFHFPDEGSVLQAYPWELLHDEHGFLFDTQRAFLVRYIDYHWQPIPIFPLEGPLHVLLIDPRPKTSSRRQASLPVLDRPNLEQLAQRYTNKLEVINLPKISPQGATLTKLHRHFLISDKMTHVIHIDTHGDFGWLCQCHWLNAPGANVCRKCKSTRADDQKMQGYLAFQDSNGVDVWVSGEELGKQLQGRNVQAVVLSACKSAMVGGSSTFNSVAGALVKQGVPAVIAMQFSIDDRAASAFVENFYLALILGKPLTEAVTEARKGLLTVTSDSWYRPVLYLRTDSKNYRGQIFQSPSNSAPPINPKLNPAPSTYLNIEPPLGTISPKSRFYIEREADSECLNLLSQEFATTIHIQAPRQMGKSSLMQRMIYRIKQSRNITTAFIDFGKFSKYQLKDEEKFLIDLCLMIGDALGLPEEINQFWKSRLRLNIVKCTNYIVDYIIPTYGKPFILGMEVEHLLDTPLSNDFFGMLRTWHNDRASKTNLAAMTIFLSSSTEPELFISNPNRSPFNVALPVFLRDFTLAEVEKLHQQHQSPLSEVQVNELFDLLGGHPFLTRLALYFLATNQIEFNTLTTQATSDTGPFGDHLRRYWQHILDMPEIKQSLTQVCRYQTHPENKLYFRLKGAGLVKKDGSHVVVRNKLYAKYFGERLND